MPLSITQFLVEAKIWNLGIQGNIYKWVKSFLEDRQQRVIVNGTKSNWRTVTSGVPQGSVLGPVLFLIFINDLPDTINCTLKFFADDTKLYKVINTNEDSKNLQENIYKACDWATKWQMTFNTKKCKIMHIGPKETTEYFTKDSNNIYTTITEVDQEKDLGVIFDKKLNFNTHISTKVNIANRNLGLISKTFIFMDQVMFLQLYKALVRPHLEYASVIWAPKYLKDSKAIENVQRRATKLLVQLQNKNYQDRLKRIGLPTLEYRRKRADLIQTYKLIKGIDKTSYNFFSFIEQSKTRGHKCKLFKHRSRTNDRRMCYNQRVVNDWNGLPQTIIEAPTLNSFKARLNNQWTCKSKFQARCYKPY